MSHLSPKVKKLLELSSAGSIPKELADVTFECLKSDSGILQNVCAAGETLTVGRDENWYETTVIKLAPFFRWCHKAISSEAVIENELLDWLSNANVYLEATKSKHLITKTLIFTVIIETSLRGVLRTGYPNAHVPPLLKSLINSEKLRQVLGEDLFLLYHIFFGSPLSLNLRNLVWHGFVTDDNDLPDVLNSCLIILVQLTGRALCEKRIEISKSPPRRSLPKCKLPSLPMSKLTKITDNSMLWTESLKNWTNANYLSSVCLLLPALESSLRVLFVKVNQCPERLLTAESTTLYTTFTEMFENKLPNGSDNELLEILGIGATEYFFDALILPDGPRLRDKICHGEVELTQNDSVLGSWIPALLTMVGAIQELITGSAGMCCKSISQHSAIYHPTSILKDSLLQSIEKFALLLSEDLSSVCEAIDVGTSSCFEFLSRGTGIYGFPVDCDEDALYHIQQTTTEHRPKTLFLPKEVYSYLTSLRRLASELETLVVDVGNHFHHKIQSLDSLSSRQLNSLRKGISALPIICKLMSSSIIIVFNGLMNLNGTDCADKKKLKAHNKLSNLLSQSSANVKKSKWDEVISRLSTETDLTFEIQ